MYNVPRYILYLYLIFICHISFYCIYESTPDYIPIHHVMHIEYGNKALIIIIIITSQSGALFLMLTSVWCVPGDSLSCVLWS